MTATWPDPDPGWRVRMGVGLVEFMPMSEERRAAVASETEKERLADEKAAEVAKQLKDEADAERAFFGVEKRSVADVLQAASVAQDRQDRRDAAAEERAAVDLGHLPPRRPSSAALLREAKAQREARVAEAESTPASQAELARGLAKLKNSVQNTIGKWLP